MFSLSYSTVKWQWIKIISPINFYCDDNFWVMSVSLSWSINLLPYFLPLFCWERGLIKQSNGHLIPCQGQLATLGNYNYFLSCTYYCYYQNSIWFKFCLANILIDIWFITSSRTHQCEKIFTIVFLSVWFQGNAVFLESERRMLFLIFFIIIF